jgi:putative glutamine amidotransferase
MNRHRDSLDMKLISKALELKMPMMGICRGHQILNVYLGGTLIVDIPSDVPAHITHQCEDYLHCHHMVAVEGGSLLIKICNIDSMLVTTNHHQAVERIAPVLASNAFSGDHVVEGFEWKDPTGKPFLLGVQWHPERMEKNNPLSGRLAETFIEKSSEYKQDKLNRTSK